MQCNGAYVSEGGITQCERQLHLEIVTGCLIAADYTADIVFMCARTDFYGLYGGLVVAFVLFVIFSQQRRVLSPSQVLLQPALALRIHITLPTEQAEKHRQQDERMRGCPQHKCDPDAEIVDFKDLYMSALLSRNY